MTTESKEATESTEELRSRLTDEIMQVVEAAFADIPVHREIFMAMKRGPLGGYMTSALLAGTTRGVLTAEPAWNELLPTIDKIIAEHVQKMSKKTGDAYTAIRSLMDLFKAPPTEAPKPAGTPS